MFNSKKYDSWPCSDWKYKIEGKEFPVKKMEVKDGKIFIELEDGRTFDFEGTDIKEGVCYIDSEYSCPEEWIKELGIK